MALGEAQAGSVEFVRGKYKRASINGAAPTAEYMADFEGMNTVWDEWVAAGHTPPRATVESKLANPACLVEIVVTAALR